MLANPHGHSSDLAQIPVFGAKAMQSCTEVPPESVHMCLSQHKRAPPKKTEKHNEWGPLKLLLAPSKKTVFSHKHGIYCQGIITPRADRFCWSMVDGYWFCLATSQFLVVILLGKADQCSAPIKTQSQTLLLRKLKLSQIGSSNFQIILFQPLLLSKLRPN